MPFPSQDLDVQLAHSFHVGLKECPISGNFSIGDLLEGDRQVLMAASPSLWEQGLLSLDPGALIDIFICPAVLGLVGTIVFSEG